jgi:Temperature dependent protein affecting M2 dsRNA replication
MLLRADARRARDDLLDIALSLPFQTEVNTGFGVLAKVYLDALTHINNRTRVRDPNAEGVREAKSIALEICEETFPGVKSPRLEVERGFRFWDVVRSDFSGLLLSWAANGSASLTGVDSNAAIALWGCSIARVDGTVRSCRSLVEADATLIDWRTESVSLKNKTVNKWDNGEKSGCRGKEDLEMWINYLNK